MFTLGILFLSLSSFGGITEGVSDAFKTGNAFKLSSFFQDKIDLTILEESDLMSKLEAEKAVYDFFHENHPSDFKILHQGNSKSGSAYTIGRLVTEKGNFRVSIYVNTSSNKELIQQIIIDSE
tara:strand:- start:30947 stop:31315 length:369 start_codon:yes stop_codon:yes gene_type:complete